jgi:hypothetical protein
MGENDGIVIFRTLSCETLVGKVAYRPSPNNLPPSSQGASFSRLRSLTKLPTEEGKASSGRLSSSSSSSSNPAARSDGVLARPHRYAKRCGREFWSTAPSPNCTRVAGRDAEGNTSAHFITVSKVSNSPVRHRLDEK